MKPIIDPDGKPPAYALEQARKAYKNGSIRKGIYWTLRELIHQPASDEGWVLLSRLEDLRQGRRKVVEFHHVEPPKTAPGLSLCMIVKNEEKNLAACLDSAKKIYDELIIVDTGSSDRTIEIAERFGAKVFHFDWDNDFSAARNYSLDQATGEWVFILDADERLLPLDCYRIQWAMLSGEADLYSCYTVNHSRDGNAGNYHVLRLFRRLPGLTYESPLHHTLVPAAIRLNLLQAQTNICVQHYGYDLDEAGWKAKNERNLRILQESIRNDPSDLFSRIVHAALLYSLGHGDDAIRDWQDCLQEAPDKFSPSSYLGFADAILIHHYRSIKQWGALIRQIDRAAIDFPDTYAIWVLIGETYFRFLKDPRSAELALRYAEKLDKETALSQAIGSLWGLTPDQGQQLLEQTFLQA